MKRAGFLVPLPTTLGVSIDPRIPRELRFTRPWVRRFLIIEGSRLSGTGGLRVTSAVRTEEYQRQLRRRNGNAAKRSTHTTGATIDITKVGYTQPELDKIRRRLKELERQGIIEATEEYNQAVFHIMVLKKY